MRDERIGNLRGIGLWILGVMGSAVLVAVSILVPISREVSNDLTEIKAGIAAFNSRVDIQRERIVKIEELLYRHDAKLAEIRR